MMQLSMSMYATSADYWKHYAELLAQTMNETAAALGVEPDNEKMLEAVDALRRDAERYRFLRDTPWPPILEADIVLHRNARWDAEIDAAMAGQG